MIGEASIEFIPLRCGQRYGCAVGGDAVQISSTSAMRSSTPRRSIPKDFSETLMKANLHCPPPLRKELRPGADDRRRNRPSRRPLL